MFIAGGLLLPPALPLLTFFLEGRRSGKTPVKVFVFIVDKIAFDFLAVSHFSTEVDSDELWRVLTFVSFFCIEIILFYDTKNETKEL